MKILNFALLLCISVFLLSSCKKEVEGCTDPKADNYDSEANVSVDNCTYQKRFAGEYTGAFECQGNFAGLFQSADLTISELAVKTEVNIVIQATIGPILVKGTIISSDSLKVDETLDNLEVVPEIFQPGAGTTPIKAIGTVKTTMGISADNKVISGVLDLTMTNKEPVTISGIPFPAGVLKLSDKCAFTGTKK